ncbi:hypothetical protein Cgig2_003817 [Carnegiea gigantea]|uniref:Uncharacterized protein n=1 Tax=Carnegiea gigantea TaxID=171969 RepID=A0A9Q1JKF6_9CARY|nr:hypothetical protein Cgig2_003817 [Carnegiea gigantea]
MYMTACFYFSEPVISSSLLLLKSDFSFLREEYSMNEVVEGRSSRPWNFYPSSDASAMSPTQTEDAYRGETTWKSFGSASMNAISFGFVATAILVSMFLIIAILEHLFRPNLSSSSQDGFDYGGLESGSAAKLRNQNVEEKLAKLKDNERQPTLGDDTHSRWLVSSNARPNAETIALMVPPNPPTKTLISVKVAGIDVEAMVGDVEVEVDVVMDLEGAAAIILYSIFAIPYSLRSMSSSAINPNESPHL